jgi:hypothetical protein
VLRRSLGPRTAATLGVAASRWQFEPNDRHGSLLCVCCVCVFCCVFALSLRLVCASTERRALTELLQFGFSFRPFCYESVHDSSDFCARTCYPRRGVPRTVSGRSLVTLAKEQRATTEGLGPRGLGSRGHSSGPWLREGVYGTPTSSDFVYGTISRMCVCFNVCVCAFLRVCVCVCPC